MVKAADGIFSQEATQMLNYAQNIETAKNALVAHSYYQSALDLFEFDSWQALPKNGRAFRGSTAAFMSVRCCAHRRSGAPQISFAHSAFATRPSMHPRLILLLPAGSSGFPIAPHAFPPRSMPLL